MQTACFPEYSMRIHNNLSKRHTRTSWLAAKAKTAKDNRIVAAKEKTATAKAKTATGQNIVACSLVRCSSTTAPAMTATDQHKLCTVLYAQ